MWNYSTILHYLPPTDRQYRTLSHKVFTRFSLRKPLNLPPIMRTMPLMARRSLLSLCAAKPSKSPPTLLAPAAITDPQLCERLSSLTYAKTS